MLRLSRSALAAATSKGASLTSAYALKRRTVTLKKPTTFSSELSGARAGSSEASAPENSRYGNVRTAAMSDGHAEEEELQHGLSPDVVHGKLDGSGGAPPQQHHSHHDHRSAGKLHFDASKAGLQQVDKDYVEQVIQEASKGSAFYQKEQRLEEARRRKAEELQEKAKSFDSLSISEKQKITLMVDTMVAELEATRDLRRRYIHIDMDMFYAAVEEKKNPSLRGKPFGVGALPMLSTTNYIARQYGVRSGMPGFIGKKLCPELIIVPNDFPAYTREAARVHSIASRYDAQFVSVGLDELTMDVTKYLHEFPAVSASDIAHDFRDEVFLKTQLTSSGGIGPTSILAKIASNVNKPNGQHEITLLTRDDVIDYVRDIPLRKIPGIGYAQEMTLGALNIHTCGDLLIHKYLLAYLFREKTLMHYLSVGLGLAETFSQRKHQSPQSIGKENSFSDPLPSPDAFVKLFRKLLEECHVRCVRQNLRPQKITLVLKYRTYDSEQFSVSLPSHTNDLKVWIEASHALLEPHLLHFAEFRLVGVRMQKFEGVETILDSHREGGTAHESVDTEPPLGAEEEFEMVDTGEGEPDKVKVSSPVSLEREEVEDASSKAPATPKRKIPISKFLLDPNASANKSSVKESTEVRSRSAVRKAPMNSKSAKRKLHRRR